MKNSEVRKASIYQMRYFESSDEAAYWLELFADEKHPLILPEYQHLQEVTQRLSDRLTIRAVLIAFQYLRESQGHTIAFCGWKNNSGRRCGGTIYQEITEEGIYYQCTLDPNHRASVEKTISDTRNITAESFWKMLCP